MYCAVKSEEKEARERDERRGLTKDEAMITLVY
jgi:hypothetical protein